MNISGSALKWIYRMRGTTMEEHDLDPSKYDLHAMNDRFYRAMVKTGRTRAEVAEMFGMDPGIPLALQPPCKVPRPTMENIVKLSSFLGVSARWLLLGEIENDVDRIVSSGAMDFQQQTTSVGPSAAHGAAIIAGASNSTITVQNVSGDSLNAMEREVIRVLRSLPAREKISAMWQIISMDKE